MDSLAKFEAQHVEELAKKKKKSIPSMRIGDTLKVLYRIQEGDKFRNQPFQGTLIKMKGSGITKTITLRKVVAGEGVERTFPLYSPNLVSIEITRFGKARRAKLYYLRGRVGKATKIKERHVIIETEKKVKKKRKRKTKEEKEKLQQEKLAKKKEKKAKKKSAAKGKARKSKKKEA
ncbi:MAG: 50S ribosomal protein L19 [Planctomycetota bacterium]|nr:MAG: 50S ribosomal protein L19 [Planctomycetota bacterium]